MHDLSLELENMIFWKHRGLQFPTVPVLDKHGVHLNMEGNYRLKMYKKMYKVKMYKDKEVQNVNKFFLSMCDVKIFLTFTSPNMVLL